MDKEVLKSALGQLKVNDTFDISFVGDQKPHSGNYKVLKISRGKGKGGSVVFNLINTVSGVKLDHLMINDKKHLIGTAVSHYIQCVTINGTVYGARTESEILSAYPKDKEAGKEMRELLLPLVNKKTPTKLQIESQRAPEFTGTWLVKEAKSNAGRFGQVSLLLEDVTNQNRQIELWSYRHGKIIDSIDELPV